MINIEALPALKHIPIYVFACFFNPIFFKKTFPIYGYIEKDRFLKIIILIYDKKDVKYFLAFGNGSKLFPTFLDFQKIMECHFVQFLNCLIAQTLFFFLLKLYFKILRTALYTWLLEIINILRYEKAVK